MLISFEDADPFHAWGVALVRDKVFGFHVLIFDPDIANHWTKEELQNLHFRYALHGFQRSLVDSLARGKEGIKIAGVWLGTNWAWRGRKRCLEATSLWLQLQATVYPDKVFDDSDLDCRFSGFVRLAKTWNK